MEKYIKAVEKNRQIIFDAHDFIWKHAETGYREWETAGYLEEQYEKLGCTLKKAGDIPGFYTDIDTGKPGPKILVLGELDSLICAEHPEANRKTGAVHSCGHSAQSAALLGIAAALKEPGMLDEMCGSIRLCAVPAEELIEIEYRNELKAKGTIKYLGGKSEFLYRGYFDGVDAAFMIHTTTGNKFMVQHDAVGCIAKRIVYKGVSAHAGGNPWDGKNALYAAMQGLGAINAVRETFKDTDMIRVHPIITCGGGAVNAVPDRVTAESYVRGKSFDAIKESNKKVNRALVGAALSLGANVDISDSPGYSPLVNDRNMCDVAYEAAKEVTDLPVENEYSISSGCTDMGDLSLIMPVVHAYVPGATGISHGCDYKIENVELACVTSAKWQLVMLLLLLSNNGERAKKIIEKFTPVFASKDEFFKYIEEFNCDGDRIEYTEDGAVVKL